MRGQFDHLAGQQLQRPTGAARWRVRARSRHQQGFLLAGELALCAGARLFAQRSLQVAFDKAPLGPVDARTADPDAQGDVLIADAGVCSQQDLGPLELPRRALTPARSALSSLRSYWVNVTR